MCRSVVLSAFVKTSATLLAASRSPRSSQGRVCVRVSAWGRVRGVCMCVCIWMCRCACVHVHAYRCVLEVSVQAGCGCVCVCLHGGVCGGCACV